MRIKSTIWNYKSIASLSHLRILKNLTDFYQNIWFEFTYSWEINSKIRRHKSNKEEEIGKDGDVFVV